MSPRKRKKANEGGSNDEVSPTSVSEEDEIQETKGNSLPSQDSNADSTLKEKKKEKCLSFRCLVTRLVVPTVLLAFFIRYAAPIIIEEYLIWRGYERATHFGIPRDVMELFASYDGDNNGALDPYEFMFAAEDLVSSERGRRRKFNMSAFNETYEPLTFLDQHRGPGQEFVEVKVDFEPLVLSSMTKFKDPSNVFGTPSELVPGLYSWKTPRVSVAQYGVKNFGQFTPPSGKGVGEPYYIVDCSDGHLIRDAMVTQMNPYNFFPPAPKSDEILLHALMLQFHKHPFVRLRFGPRGTMGIIRAENDKYWDILIRAHVEFQLNTYPDLPFWFTPAQFAGRLIMSKDSSHIVLFEMEVPNNRSLNIDMEWLTSEDGENNEVDIGFVPLMKLSSVGPSCKEGTPTPLPSEAEPKWTKEIDTQAAKDTMERAMYPFKEVKYHDFKEAFDLASEQQKPVHHILLWGALDDQSC